MKEPGNPGISRLPPAQGSREINYHLPRRWTVLLREAFDVFDELSLIAWVEETLIFMSCLTRRSPTLVVG